MTLKTQVAKLANKEMDRREFLKYSGVILLGVVGITGLMRIMTSFGGDSATVNGATRRNYYGSSQFGK
ncbi:hypothetical protein FWG95_01410 [Candidatus Saccharibacteria bacterium]|nr:hypothetical protein [Candidatus Saccharibacteria bacterium]